MGRAKARNSLGSMNSMLTPSKRVSARPALIARPILPGNRANGAHCQFGSGRKARQKKPKKQNSVMNTANFSSKISISLVCWGAIALATTGQCSSKSKEPAEHHRGWIGGEFKAVSVVPPELKGKQRHAILITSLNTNTPAALAGLAEGDLLLELNHQPVT